MYDDTEQPLVRRLRPKYWSPEYEARCPGMRPYLWRIYSAAGKWIGDVMRRPDGVHLFLVKRVIRCKRCRSCHKPLKPGDSDNVIGRWPKRVWKTTWGATSALLHRRTS